MKFISSSHNIITILVTLFTIEYAYLIVGNDRVIEDQYTVKMNDVPFRRDVAEGVLLRIKAECKCKSMDAYDNVHKRDILLSEIKKDMDVNIRGSELLSVLSDLHREYLTEIDNTGAKIRQAEGTKCIGRELKFNKVPVRIEICVDSDDSRVSYLLVFTKSNDIKR